jgi:glycosyltransferase involved in cell wall biosynthesis
MVLHSQNIIQTPSAPLVTVIIATWNWSSVLPYSIGSALRQSVSDIEVLVIGDCCTDDSQQVVEAIDDPRVRWVNLPENSGHQFGPNNEGIRLARGKYIAYLGHDDLWLPHHLSSLIAEVERGADMAYGIVRSVYPADEVHPELAVPTPYAPGLSIPPSSVLHRKELISTIGDWRDYRKIGIDPEADLWKRIYEAGFQLRFVPRLTTINLPASARRDVYKQRPCHEQKAWSRRIDSEVDLEITELATMMLAAQANGVRRSGARPYSGVVREFLAETLARIHIRVSGVATGTRHNGNMIAYRKRFKGIDSGD